MFVKNHQQFGSFDSIIIHNQDASYLMHIVPSYGANLIDLKIKGESVIDGVANDTELIENNAYKSVFLAPFPNRIKDGKYNYDGTTYQLPINEKPLNNALHGLIYTADFKVISENLASDFAEVVLEYTYNASVSGYPFQFKTQLTMILSEKDGFKCTMSFTNLEERKIPFGYGWHPYFKLGEKVKDLELQTPHVKKFNVDEQMIPDGPAKSYDVFSNTQLIDGTQLDDCFEIENTGSICETTLTTSKGTSLTLWQETGDKKLNYLQIYIPPHGDAIAIEPQTACIDAFNNGFGLFELEPKEHIKASFGIKIETD